MVSTAWSGVTYVGQGEAEFTVIDSDVSIDVAVGGLGEIQVVILDKTRTDCATAPLVLGRTLAEGAAQGKQLSSDRSIRFDRVPPDHYTFSLLKSHDGADVESVGCGGGEVSVTAPLWSVRNSLFQTAPSASPALKLHGPATRLEGS